MAPMVLNGGGHVVASNISAHSDSLSPPALDDIGDIYRFMLLMRRFEETAGQIYALGLINREIKLSIGREALTVGLMRARAAQDPVVVGPRCHGALLAFGLDVEHVLAALIETGLDQFDPSAKIKSKQDIRPAQFYCNRDGVNSALLWAVSSALLRRNQSSPDVVFVVLDGDAVTPQALQTPLAFADRWQLPIVIIIDHATPERALYPEGLETMQAHVQFPPVDGIEYQTVSRACIEAARRARAGEGPQGLCISTQAFRGHAHKAAPAGQAATGHSQQMTDPVLRARARVVAAGPGGADQANLIDTQVRAFVRQAGMSARTRFGT